METNKLHNLNELETKVTELRNSLKNNRSHEYQVISNSLFRGQSNSNWGLETTLERYTEKEYSVPMYNTTLWAIAPAISAFTDKEWPIDPDEVLSKDSFHTPPSYEFMAYARHHGFPSPLLDWSQSLYVSLFFAYKEAKPNQDVAIYAYVESLHSGKSGWAGAPQICELGPYVKTHKRHFAQQGQYTIAVKEKGNTWVYCSHKDAFEESKGRDQDLLYKFSLPGNLKDEILAKLNEMNINAFTLYASEESLMETLAYKEITLRNL